MYPFYIILYSVFFAQNFYAYKISIIEVNILCLFSLLRVIFTILQQKHTKKTKLSETSLIITTLIIELANLIFLAKKEIMWLYYIILFHIYEKTSYTKYKRLLSLYFSLCSCSSCILHKKNTFAFIIGWYYIQKV